MDGIVAGASRPEIKLTVAKKDEQPFVKGRRKFFRYRDLGVQAATGGKLRAQVMEAMTGMTEPIGWHTHECEAQVMYMLKGWGELEFEGGTSTRQGSGEG